AEFGIGHGAAPYRKGQVLHSVFAAAAALLHRRSVAAISRNPPGAGEDRRDTAFLASGIV
ncbi:hypothetical protein QOU18_28380, partial [Pseudomonas aeruginosa]